MSVITFLLILSLTFGLGLAVSLWSKLNSLWEIWGLSWLLGMGISTMVWFLSYQVGGLPFSLTSLFMVLVGCNIVGWLSLALLARFQIFWFWIRVEEAAAELPNLRKKFQDTPLPMVLGSGLIILCAFVLFQDLFWPVTDWDALALYDFRAKVMVETGSLAQGVELGYFFQYPLFTSALHAATYLSGLKVAKIWYALLFQAFLSVFYVTLRKRTSLTMSLWGTLFLGTSSLMFLHSLMAYTNLPFTIYCSLGFIYLWQWWLDGKAQHQFMGALLVGLSTWIRISEPFYMLATLLLILGLVRDLRYKRTNLLSVVIFVASMLLIWFTRYPWDRLIVSISGRNVNTPLTSLSLVQTWSPAAFVSRTSEVVAYLWRYSAPVYLRYALVASLLLVVDLRQKRWQIIMPWLTLISFMGLIFTGTLLLSFSLESWNRIGDSVARMSMFLVPLWIYIIFTSPSWLSTNNKVRV